MYCAHVLWKWQRKRKKGIQHKFLYRLKFSSLLFIPFRLYFLLFFHFSSASVQLFSFSQLFFKFSFSRTLSAQSRWVFTISRTFNILFACHKIPHELVPLSYGCSVISSVCFSFLNFFTQFNLRIDCFLFLLFLFFSFSFFRLSLFDYSVFSSPFFSFFVFISCGCTLNFNILCVFANVSSHS